MKRYFKIYIKLLQLSWSSLLIYRSNFFNSIASSLVWSFFNIFAIVMLTSRTSSVFGWTRDELLVLVACSNILLGIFYFLFSINFYSFSEIINLGKLDSILLKPLDSQFAISLWQSSFQSLSRSLFGTCVAIFVLSQMHAHLTFFNIFAFMCLLLVGIVLQYSIWFSVITLTIWFTTLSNLNDLLYNTNDFTRFPPEMFRGAKEILYFVIFPFTLIVVVPVKALLEKATIIDLTVLLLFAGLFFYGARRFFYFALRSYTSTN